MNPKFWKVFFHVIWCSQWLDQWIGHEKLSQIDPSYIEIHLLDNKLWRNPFLISWFVLLRIQCDITIESAWRTIRHRPLTYQIKLTWKVKSEGEMNQAIPNQTNHDTNFHLDTKSIFIQVFLLTVFLIRLSNASL